MNARADQDPTRCPVCGGPNACGAAAGASRCWCEDVPGPDDGLAASSAAACLCAACVAGETTTPCLTDCVLDRRSGSCAGCLRTLSEIERWPRLDAAGRSLVYRRLATRRAPRREEGRA